MATSTHPNDDVGVRAAAPAVGRDLRHRILLVAFIGLLGALVLAGTSLWSLAQVSSAADDIDAAAAVEKAASDIRADVLDVKRLQNRYLLRAEVEGARVVAPDSPHRRLFLSREADLARALREFPPVQLESSRAELQAIRDEFERFRGIDARIAALVAQGRPEGRAQAVALSMVDSTNSAAAMTKASGDLVGEVHSRVVAAHTAKNAAIQQARVVVFLTLVLVFAGIVEAAGIIAQLNESQPRVERAPAPAPAAPSASTTDLGAQAAPGGPAPLDPVVTAPAEQDRGTRSAHRQELVARLRP